MPPLIHARLLPAPADLSHKAKTAKKQLLADLQRLQVCDGMRERVCLVCLRPC